MLQESLRCYSDQSINIGTMLPNSIPKIAKERGYTSVALTDFMSMSGFLKFYKECKKQEIKPILGVELLVHNEKFGEYKILSYAKTNTGLKNLFELLSICYMKNKKEFKKPIFVENDFFNKSLDLEDIIFTSGGVFGVTNLIFKNNEIKNKDNEVYKIYNKFVNKFNSNFYFEINRLSTNELPKELVNFSNRLNFNYCHTINGNYENILFTHPVLFATVNDYQTHQVRAMSSESLTVNNQILVDNKYIRSMHFISSKEIINLIDDIQDIIIANHQRLTDKINIELVLGKNFLPKFKTPDNSSETDYFVKISNQGLQERLVALNITNNEEIRLYQERLDFEIKTIINMGFVGYFLIVQDFIKWSKDNSIPVGAGRGSGAGSLVAYSLHITDLNPLPYGLLFERFLNPERVSMPDFDIDFCQDKRDLVIKYVCDKYGFDAVSQIMTNGTMAAKAVIKDVARVLNKPLALANQLANLVDPNIGLIESYNDNEFKNNGMLRNMVLTDDDVAQIWQHAIKLEGLSKSIGKHAAGILIAPNKLTDFCPLFQLDDNGNGFPVAQLDKYDVEEVGLVKFDFLALRNLTIIQNTIEMIKKNYDIDFKFIEKFDDSNIYKNIFQKANTVGVFQVESDGMKNYLEKMKPDKFEDIIAMLALYRPGPLNSGMVESFIKRKRWEEDGKPCIGENLPEDVFNKLYEKSDYFVPALESCLKPTYGIIVYQEQVMQVSQIIAGYSLGAADLLRRAMGKKKPEEMAKQREVFVTGALKNNYSEELATHLFDLMEKFAEYGFNKSHSAAYAVISYQTAYLKNYYVSEFLAATLTSEIEDTDAIEKLISDCYKNNVKVNSPDINLSNDKFYAKDGIIYYALSAIKKVNSSVIATILKERFESGDYINFDNFCQRNILSLNKAVLEGLILSGSFDRISKLNRQEMYECIDSILRIRKKLLDLTKKRKGLINEDEYNLIISLVEFEKGKSKKSEISKNSLKDYILKERNVLGFELTNTIFDSSWKSYSENILSNITNSIFKRIEDEESATKVVNINAEKYDIYIGRAGNGEQPSKWGNEYVLQNDTPEERARVIENYKQNLWQKIMNGEITEKDLLELSGKKLGCFCKPKACHGDVLVNAVNWIKKKDRTNVFDVLSHSRYSPSDIIKIKDSGLINDEKICFCTGLDEETQIACQKPCNNPKHLIYVSECCIYGIIKDVIEDDNGNARIILKDNFNEISCRLSKDLLFSYFKLYKENLGKDVFLLAKCRVKFIRSIETNLLNYNVECLESNFGRNKDTQEIEKIIVRTL